LIIKPDHLTVGGPLPFVARQLMILPISAGWRMTAITSILLPHLGQAMTSNSYTVASSRAQALLLEGVLTT
jgi:hypothetical protein